MPLAFDKIVLVLVRKYYYFYFKKSIDNNE